MIFKRVATKRVYVCMCVRACVCVCVCVWGGGGGGGGGWGGGGLEIPFMLSISSEHEQLIHRFEKYAKDVLSKK